MTKNEPNETTTRKVVGEIGSAADGTRGAAVGATDGDTVKVNPMGAIFRDAGNPLSDNLLTI